MTKHNVQEALENVGMVYSDLVDIANDMLKVAEGDIGKVIGKYGRIAKAMRTVLSASAVKDGKHYSLDILD
jgi:predicted RNA-binding protein YlqC (UPF0109 family)